MNNYFTALCAALYSDQPAIPRTLIQMAKIGTLSAAAIILTACVSFPEANDELSNDPMEPIPKPQWSAGMHYESIDLVNGESSGYEVLDVAESGELRLRSKRGGDAENCIWVSSSDWFAPATKWENCGTGDWKSGTQVVSHEGEELWPLRAGAKAVYKRTPTSSTGETGTPETLKCAVSGPVNVALKSGNYNAMKVNCNAVRWDGAKETRTWYWTTEHGQIKYRKAHSRDGVVTESEMVLPVASAE